VSRSPRRRTRDDPEVRRAHIIEQAIRIMGERGYYGFTIQGLAQRCRLSNAGLLYYFPSKDQLFIAVVQELERRETRILEPLVAAAEQQHARVSASAAAFMDVLRTMLARGTTQPELGRFFAVLQSESLDKIQPAHQSYRLRESRVLELFAKLVAPYVEKPHSTARQLLALMQGLALQWLREDQTFDMLAEWVGAIRTVVPGLFTARGKQDRRPGLSRRGKRPSLTNARRRASQ
jgi:AcrR family transcriptional regulator